MEKSLYVVFFLGIIATNVACFTLSELVIQLGITAHLCLLDGNFICDLGNGTVVCSTDYQICTQSQSMLNCSLCESYNLTTCRVTNDTSGQIEYYDSIAQTESCSTAQNCSEVFTTPKENITISLVTSCVDCCVGHSRDYWKTHNAFAESPNNISWPLSETTPLCLTTYYFAVSSNISIPLNAELVVALLNKELAGSSCLNETDISLINQANDFVTSHCWYRYPYVGATMATANYLKTKLEELNSRLIC
jgi:hypothetical protein